MPVDGFGLGGHTHNCAFGCSGSPTTLDEVIEPHAKAVGGRAAAEAIQAIEFDLNITDPKFEVDGTYFAARPGKMRLMSRLGGEHVFTKAFEIRLPNAGRAATTSCALEICFISAGATTVGWSATSPMFRCIFSAQNITRSQTAETIPSPNTQPR